MMAVALKKLAKLKAQGFTEYAAVCLRNGDQYCVVGELGDVRYVQSQNDNPILREASAKAGLSSLPPLPSIVAHTKNGQ